MSLVVDYLKIIGLVCGTLAAIAAAAKTSPLGRGLATVYRRLIGDPVRAWFRAEVNSIIDERLMTPNGGKSLADISHKLDRLLERLPEEES